MSRDWATDEVVGIAIGILIMLFYAVLLGGCPKPVPTPVGPIVSQSDIPNCVTDALPTANDLCGNLFTKDGYACAACPSSGGCLDVVDMIYCVVDTCIKDKRCMLQTADNF